jgi:hypothetical protein
VTVGVTSDSFVKPLPIHPRPCQAAPVQILPQLGRLGLALLERELEPAQLVVRQETQRPLRAIRLRPEQAPGGRLDRGQSALDRLHMDGNFRAWVTSGASARV